MIPNDVTPTTALVKRTTSAISTRKKTRPRPYTASAKSVAANQGNAGKATGPRTVVGKAASRLNAITHGILSTEVVVRGLRIQERADEFRHLRERCWKSLAPVGPMEEMLVDRIVTAQWRLRRVLMAETGEIVLSVDGGLRHAERAPLPLPLGMFKSELRDPVDEMEKSAHGLDYLRAVLQVTRTDVENEGGLTPGVYEQLLRRFIDEPNSLTRDFLRLRERFKESESVFAEAMANRSVVASEPAEKSADASTAEQSTTADAPADGMADEDEMTLEELRENQRGMVLEFIKQKLAGYEALSVQIAEREDKEETARQAANVLPSAPVLEKILRYESALERQLYRAMNQLERLQRRREGEDVPPPVTMQLARG